MRICLGWIDSSGTRARNQSLLAIQDPILKNKRKLYLDRIIHKFCLKLNTSDLRKLSKRINVQNLV